MLFSKNTHTKKHLAIVLVLLTALTTIPLLTAQASVTLLYFRAVAGASTITLEWATAQELDNLGFNLYRSQTNDFEDAVTLNSGLIAGNTGSATGATYEWEDTNVVVGTQYTYWLEDLGTDGIFTLHDPVTASATGGGAIPTQPSSGNSTATPTPTRTPTRTPTTQSQSGATATPTSTRSATATASSSNPTATSQTQTQSQATAATSNTTSGSSNSGSQAQSTANSIVATNQPVESQGQEDPLPTDTPDASPGQLGEGAQEESQQEISQLPGEEESTENINATQIGSGQDGQGAEEATQQQDSSSGPNRSTAVLMALIASVVLLLAGVGGVVVLLINRNKQTRT